MAKVRLIASEETISKDFLDSVFELSRVPGAGELVRANRLTWKVITVIHMTEAEDLKFDAICKIVKERV